MFANGFPDSCRRSSEAFVDDADVKSSGAAAGAAVTGAGAELAGADTPKRSRIFGVSSGSGAGGAAKGFEADAVDLNFSIAASSSCSSLAAVFSSITSPEAAPKALAFPVGVVPPDPGFLPSRLAR